MSVSCMPKKSLANKCLGHFLSFFKTQNFRWMLGCTFWNLGPLLLRSTIVIFVSKQLYILFYWILKKIKSHNLFSIDFCFWHIIKTQNQNAPSIWFNMTTSLVSKTCGYYTKTKVVTFEIEISPIKFSKCNNSMTLNGGIKNGCSIIGRKLSRGAIFSKSQLEFHDCFLSILK